MTPIEEHLEYVYQCAEVHAARIIETTKRHFDFEDYRDHLVYELVKAAPGFDSSRSEFTTFASMVISRAASKVLKRYFKRHVPVYGRS